jgi:hypothetical protein
METNNSNTNGAAAPAGRVDEFLAYLHEVGPYNRRDSDEDAEVERLRSLALASGEQHAYRRTIDGGYGGDEIVRAESLAEAMDEAEEWARDGYWDTSHGTIWVTWSVEDLLTEESTSAKITIDPDEPDCLPESAGHRWDNPVEIVGGSERSPGVYSSGGGVTCTDVCMICGCARVVDTWAQDRYDGEQGLESVSYDPGRWADEVQALARAEDES